MNLREIARALHGEVSGRQVLAPGPNHSRTDRSLSVRLSAQSPTGWITYSHAGDRFDVCRDYVAERLGTPLDAWRTKSRPSVDNIHGWLAARHVETLDNVQGTPSDHAARIAQARAIWDETADARGTVVETYLAGRGLDLVYNIHEVIRYHARCPWRDDASGQVIRVSAMICAMRSVTNDTITAVHKTRLTAEGVKVARKMQGVAAGAAMKLDADDMVESGLHLAEGIETALAGRQLGFRPVWALGSAGGIKAFPVLGGIECLTILAENDATNARAVEACASRWHQAGREVIVVEPTSGSDILDAMRGVA